MENVHKIAGYVLLAAGILLIILPLWQTYQIFTGKAVPPQIFMKPVQSGQPASGVSIEAQIQQAVLKVMPVGALYDSLNLGNWLILMWILIYGGGKLSEIGVKLIKP